MRLRANIYSPGSFKRHGPDLIIDELAKTLSKKSAFEFKALFEVISEHLGGGSHAYVRDEMLRLRVYEKLQFLVGRGLVEKTVSKGTKKYRGCAALAASIAAAKAEDSAKKHAKGKLHALR